MRGDPMSNGILQSIGGYASLQAKAIEGTKLRHEAIVTNIANTNTPNYKRKTVQFEEFLSDALDSQSFKGATTDSRHIQIGASNIKDVNILVTEDNKSANMKIDGNNVDIDSEMALLAKNEIKYNALIQNISGQFTKLKSAINEGRK
jgi:flagellar basal-body rod protein FlgB